MVNNDYISFPVYSFVSPGVNNYLIFGERGDGDRDETELLSKFYFLTWVVITKMFALSLLSYTFVFFSVPVFYLKVKKKKSCNKNPLKYLFFFCLVFFEPKFKSFHTPNSFINLRTIFHTNLLDNLPVQFFLDPSGYLLASDTNLYHCSLGVFCQPDTSPHHLPVLDPPSFESTFSMFILVLVTQEEQM